jgi:HEAT repeat protein/cyclophilin family peptidyl-prolyl cis-trans isomerase
MLAQAAPPQPPPEVAALLAEISKLEDQRQTQGGRLLELLQHESAAVRARAARALGRIQDPASLEPLAVRLEDPDLPVVREAAFALGQLFDRRAAPYLLPLLDAEDAVVRQRVIEAIGKSGDRNATPELLARFTDEDRSVRAMVPLACARLGDQNATTTLCQRFEQEPDPHVRWRIAYALATLGDERATPTLVQALRDQALPLIRVWAVQGLRGAADQPTVHDAVLTTPGDPDYRVVVELLRLVTNQPASFALEDVSELANHSSFHVRAQLAPAVAAIGGNGAAAALEALRGDSSPTVRAAATEALSRLLDRYALPLLGAAAQDDDWRLRRAAVRGYTHIAGDRALEGLEALLQDPDVRVRIAAIEARGQREGALPSLLEALGDEDVAIRGTAVEALLASDDPIPVVPLIRALESWQGRESGELRETVARGLGRSGDQQALPVLERCLEDPYTAVRAAAAEAISRITGEPPPAWTPAAAAPPDDPETPPPPELLPLGARPLVTITTDRGEILLELHPDDAPRHVARFLQSVDRQLYDGLTFHRVVSNFVIQGGDPLGHGWGDAGFTLRDEVNPLPFLTGTVGMPTAGKDTGGCQIFITHGPQPRLDGRYTVFGTVRVGMDVVEAIEVGDVIRFIRRVVRDGERRPPGGR